MRAVWYASLEGVTGGCPTKKDVRKRSRKSREEKERDTRKPAVRVGIEYDNSPICT